MTSNSADTAKKAGTASWATRTFTRFHVLLNRLSGGRLFNSLAGDDVCFVTMTGAKSGRTMTIPLMFVPYHEGVLLVASMAGGPRNPAWYYNLVANPDITVSHRGRSEKLRARLASIEEKPELWPICDRYYAPYAEYRERTDRDIPIFVCE